MHYFSTNRRSPAATFREALLNGQPDDRGLYFPENIPRFADDLIPGLAAMTNAEIAFRVLRPYAGGEIPDDELERICAETTDFPFPLVELSDQVFVLELFHGPTLAFKDVGARFMSRCLRYFSRDSGQKTVVIVATSGDTGGAVASGFHGIDGIEVVILYPKGKVSRVQELQLTTLGGNVTTLEVHGSFDDCQRLAKTALADADLRSKVFLTSANSINIARWLPQQVYYLYALKQWDGPPPVISVPSGNFGNLAAGMLANRSGMPASRFIAACNANDVVPEYFRTGSYRPKMAVATLSNAMDVGDPSNFVRIMEMYGGDRGKLSMILEAVSVTDDRTMAAMREVFDRFGYVLDPHGAVGHSALAEYMADNRDSSGFFLETAHPVKFDSVAEILGNHSVLPDSVLELANRPAIKLGIEPEYQAVKEILERVV